ncbi:g12477 [Coccomyxa viridis]|uniref:G12477 protein n=1 Tax=Coccomyxa viridis TaxID=1274662 RepID=A0ABP1GEK0_9CHLO
MVRKILTIDISDFEARKDEIASQLISAARDVGFFYIAGHGIPQEDFDRVLAAGQKFLALPESDKTQWPFNPDTYLGHRGSKELETVTGNRLWEWYSVGRYGTAGYDVKAQKFAGEEWPEVLGEEWRRTALDYQAKVHRVAIIILKAIFIGLGRDEKIIDEAFDIASQENPSFVAWNYYPPITPKQKAQVSKGQLPPRLHAHADMDVLTILYQREGDLGLEIAPGNEVEDLSLIEDVGNIWNHVPVAREWTPLDPKQGLLTVNIGDGLTRWTDGLLKSTYHRVRAPTSTDPQGARYSVPYFVNPKLNYIIEGPEKRFSPVTGFDLLSKTGNAYAARKNDPEKAWQKLAYGSGAEGVPAVAQALAVEG